MTDTIKVLEPTVVPDAKFPIDGNDVLSNSGSASGTGKAFGTETIADTPMPTKQIARELLSTALNTKSKKILQEFQFTPSGAIQVGKYENGVTGDIRISPTGILARDSLGETTFALDGETGDAIFKGTVRAGDFEVVDDQGLVSLSAFSSGSVTGSGDQSMTGSTLVDLTGVTISFSLTRTTNVLLISTMYVFGDGVIGTTGIVTALDGVLLDANLFNSGSGGFSSADIGGKHYTLQTIRTLGAGTHTLKMQGNTSSAGSTDIHKDYQTLTYITLGR